MNYFLLSRWLYKLLFQSILFFISYCHNGFFFSSSCNHAGLLRDRCASCMHHSRKTEGMVSTNRDKFEDSIANKPLSQAHLQ